MKTTTMIFEPTNIRGLDLKNRIVVAPMMGCMDYPMLGALAAQEHAH